MFGFISRTIYCVHKYDAVSYRFLLFQISGLLNNSPLSKLNPGDGVKTDRNPEIAEE